MRCMEEHPLTRLYRKNLGTLIMLLPDKEDEAVQEKQPRPPAPTGLPVGELPNADRPEPREQMRPRPPGA